MVGDSVDTFTQALGPDGDAVIGAPWQGNAERVAALYAAVSVVAVPSRYESFGLMAVEAAAVGTPVVAAPVGGMQDVFGSASPSRAVPNPLFPSRDPRTWRDALITGISRLFDHPERAASMAQDARSWIHDHLGPDRIAARLETVYETVRARPTRPSLGAPRWNEADDRKHRRTLERLAGTAAAGHAQAISGWQNAIDDHCEGCTRARVAAGLVRLVELRRRSSLPDHEVTTAVRAACPLALLQQAQVRDRQRAFGDLRFRSPRS